jgi:hypothetical protein
VDVRRAVEEVRARGHELVVLEAGPHVVGSMLGEELVDELFLTVSPLVAGREEGPDPPRLRRGPGAAARRAGGRRPRRGPPERRPPVPALRVVGSRGYLISVNSLNIGRYIERMIVATMQPTRMIMIGSMMEVSAEMVASTSSS